MTLALASGVLAVRWMVSKTDRELRGALLGRARLAARAVDVAGVQALAGREADLANPAYQQLKRQLVRIRTADPECRFVYLMGWRPAGAGESVAAPADGVVFFFADSEPPTSRDYSPPGQVYAEASEAHRQVLRTGEEVVAGPGTDRWGTWVSAAAALRDPSTGRVVAALGLDVDAHAWRRTVRAAAVWPVGLSLVSLASLVLSAVLMRSRRLLRTSYTSLRESEVRLRLTHQATNDVVWDWDVVRDLQQWNAAGAAVFGWYDIVDAPQSAGWWVERVHPDDRSRTHDGFMAVVDDPTRGIWQDEYRFRRADGSYAQVRDRGYVLRDPHGKAVRMVGAMLDVTEQQRAAEELRRRDALLDAAARTGRMLLAIQDPGQALERIVHLLGEAAGQDRVFYFERQGEASADAVVVSLRHEWARPGIASQRENPALQGLPLSRLAPRVCAQLGKGQDLCGPVRELPAGERALFEPQGLISCLLVPVLVDGGFEGFTGFGNCQTDYAWSSGERQALAIVAASIGDALARWRAEEAAERNRLLLRTVLDVVPAYICAKSRAGRFLLVNQKLAAFYGTTVEAMTGRLHAELCRDAEELRAMLAADREVIEGGVPKLIPEETMENPDGTQAVLETYKLPFVANDEPAVLIVSSDITARKRMESERERLTAAIEQAGEAVVITDTDGIIRYVNPAFTLITGYTREEAVGQSPRLLKSGAQDDAFYRAMWQTLASGRRWAGRMVNVRKDGTRYTEDATISPVLGANGTIANYVAVQRDVTERLRLSNELQQAQKLETVGRLAGGVAHDFNNLLMGILNYAELCRDHLEPGHRIREWLDEITVEAERSANLTRQLLTFARKQSIVPAVQDVNEAVTAMLKLLRRLIGEDIDLTWTPGGDLWLVKVDPGQVDQILANLCVNARDAIAGTGLVAIETANAVLDAAYCAAHAGCAPGEYVRLSVADNGCGMSPEVIERIFEPFFTTKGHGKGTGLGLATVYGIVQQNEGHIAVTSAPGQGTRFDVYLRRFQPPASPAEARPPAVGTGRSETLLLVEDEKSVRLTCQRFLEKRGYVVLAAATPAEALRLASEHVGHIHLLITDVVMPGMNGKELAARLGVLRPGLGCLFISGYTADIVADRKVEGDGVELLPKPFTSGELDQRVRQLLDR